MARLVKRFRNQPYAVTLGAETEEAGKLYWYDDAGVRHLAADGEGYYMRSDQQPQAA